MQCKIRQIACGGRAYTYLTHTRWRHGMRILFIRRRIVIWTCLLYIFFFFFADFPCFVSVIIRFSRFLATSPFDHLFWIAVLRSTRRFSFEFFFKRTRLNVYVRTHFILKPMTFNSLIYDLKIRYDHTFIKKKDCCYRLK